MKNRDWNCAAYNDADNNSLMSSEVFRNYVKIAEMYEKQDLEEEKNEDLPDESEDMDEIVRNATDEAEKYLKTLDTDSNNLELYKDTGAGESQYIDIGITPETEKLMEDGIDYCETCKTNDINNEKEKISEDEIRDAEKQLGLDKDALYILHQLNK